MKGREHNPLLYTGTFCFASKCLDFSFTCSLQFSLRMLCFLHHAVAAIVKTHISPLLTMESPVAQWLEHPTRSRRVVGLNPIWSLDFLPSLLLMRKLHVVLFLQQRLTWWLDGCISDMP